MIREAELSDIPFILDLGKRFADEAGVTERTGWSEADVEALLVQMIESEAGILLVSETGIFGGVIAAHPFNQAAKVLMEMFWRSEGRDGLRLLSRAEELAKERGATHSTMVGMATMPDVGKLYARRGYAPCETYYFKEF